MDQQTNKTLPVCNFQQLKVSIQILTLLVILAILCGIKYLKTITNARIKCNKNLLKQEKSSIYSKIERVI